MVPLLTIGQPCYGWIVRYIHQTKASRAIGYFEPRMNSEFEN